MAPSWPAPRREVAIAMPLNAARVVPVGRGMLVEDIACSQWLRCGLMRSEDAKGGKEGMEEGMHSRCRRDVEDWPFEVTYEAQWMEKEMYLQCGGVRSELEAEPRLRFRWCASLAARLLDIFNSSITQSVSTLCTAVVQSIYLPHSTSTVLDIVMRAPDTCATCR